MTTLIKNKAQINWFDLTKYEAESKLNIGEWLSHFMVRDSTEMLFDVMPQLKHATHQQSLSKKIFGSPIIDCSVCADSSEQSMESSNDKAKKTPFVISEKEFFESSDAIREVSPSEIFDYAGFLTDCANIIDNYRLNPNDIPVKQFEKEAKLRRAKKAIEIVESKQARLLIDLTYTDKQVKGYFAE